MPATTKKKTTKKKATAKKPLANRKFVPNQRQLAEALGVTSRTIGRMRQHEDCPEPLQDGRYDVAAYKKFKEEIWEKEKSANNQSGVSALTEYRTEREKIKVEREQWEFDCERGKYASQEEIAKELGEVFSAVVEAQKQIVNSVYRDLVGLDEIDAKLLLQKETKKALEKFSLGEWAKKKPFWSMPYATLQDLQATYQSTNG